MSQTGNSGYNSVFLGTITNSLCMTEGERARKTHVRALLQNKDHLMSEPAAQTTPRADSASQDKRCHKTLLSKVLPIYLPS